MAESSVSLYSPDSLDFETCSALLSPRYRRIRHEHEMKEKTKILLDSVNIPMRTLPPCRTISSPFQHTISSLGRNKPSLARIQRSSMQRYAVMNKQQTITPVGVERVVGNRLNALRPEAREGNGMFIDKTEFEQPINVPTIYVSTEKERHPSLGKPSINAFTSQETHKIPALAVHLSPRAPRSALCNEFDKKQSYQEETRSAYSTMDEWNLSFPLPPPKRHNVPYHISSQRKIREIQQTDMIHRVAIKARTFEKRVEELTKRRAKTANQAHFLRPLHESIPYFNE